MAHRRLVVLLPVRNGEADLPGWLDSVRAYADGVAALEDGSTDGTHALLTADPLVTCVLTNPRRDTYAGWDDAANRQRLLDAAADLDPAWILFLDADERLDPSDWRALRTFVDGPADPQFAYGLRVHRMTADGEHFDRNQLWVYRLFAFEPGMQLPERRLHLVPVPTSIPPDKWVRTTLRIQHFGSSTDVKRRARLEKYRAADPAEEFQSEYVQLLDSGGPATRWEERSPETPVVLDRPGQVAGTASDVDSAASSSPITRRP